MLCYSRVLCGRPAVVGLLFCFFNHFVSHVVAWKIVPSKQDLMSFCVFLFFFFSPCQPVGTRVVCVSRFGSANTFELLSFVFFALFFVDFFKKNCVHFLFRICVHLTSRFSVKNVVSMKEINVRDAFISKQNDRMGVKGQNVSVDLVQD